MKKTLKKQSENILFLLEEFSAEEMLKGFIQRCFPSLQGRCQYRQFRGKDNLLKRLPHVVQDYANQCSTIIILCDQDNDDCMQLKNKMIGLCRKAGFQSKCIVRILCHELESWYLAQLDVVANRFGVTELAKRQDHYMNPDSIKDPCKELKRMTKENYQKVKGSRIMGQFINPDVTRSTSFKHFVAVLKRIAAE
ncbi:hypothetical protein FACS1894170_05190 [Planctomycetales bacterium]|nr:hypothetical protein FACS1894170_05190 [Planctomycetales bacterium]